ALQQLDAEPQVAVAAARPRLDEVALAEERCDGAGKRTLALLPTAQDHVGEARMGRETAHGAARRGDAAGGVERLEVAEQERRRLGTGSAGRRIEPGEGGRIGDAPAGEIEGQGCQIGIQNFRRREGRQQRLLVLGPEAIAEAGLYAAGASPALLAGGPGDAG